MTYPFETTEGYNLRQDYLNQATRAQLSDDGIIDVYVDTEGVMRNNGWAMNDTNVQTIVKALEHFDALTGIDINFVDTEAKSELSFHKLDPRPGKGFEAWGLSPYVRGLVHSKNNQDNNVYFEGGANGEYTKYVIYHEVAHIFGAYELASPWETCSTDSVMGYCFTGFAGYTEADKGLFQDLYGPYDTNFSMYNRDILGAYL